MRCDTYAANDARLSIELTQGKYCMIDAADYHIIQEYNWYAAEVVPGKWYAACSISKNENVLMHRLLLNADPEAFIDHKDNNGLNNTRDNIRLATRRDNAGNSYLPSRLGFKGVEQVTPYRYRARIMCADGVRRSLGNYDTPEEAAQAYDRRAIIEFGEFAGLNFDRSYYNE